MQATTKPVWNGRKPALREINWESGPDRKLCHNTYRETHYEYVDWDSDTIRTYPSIRFHSTTIVVALGNGTYRINSGGWRTNTTKQRLNALLFQSFNSSIQIWQKNFEWFVSDANGIRPFEDNMIVSL